MVGGVIWEGHVITQDLYDSDGKNAKFIPVVFYTDDLAHIPKELRSATIYNLTTEAGYDKLFRRLTNQPERLPSPVADKVRAMPPLWANTSPLLVDREPRLPAMPPRKKRQDFVATTSTVTINIYDGTRQPFKADSNILYRVVDGHQNQILLKEIPAASVTVKSLPFYDNAGDNYSVVVFADGYQQAGFFPVKLSPQQPVTLDLMLVPNDPEMNFADAFWDNIKTQVPLLAAA